MQKNNIVNELKQLFNQQQLFSSFIIDGKNQQETQTIIDELIRYMFCENKSLTNDNCPTCIRAVKHEIFDVVYIGDGINAIDKEEIQNMISKMSLSATEKTGTKVYVIANAENLKSTASNSLLKFLEEPPANTFAILLTKDRSNVLQTIKSRCKVFVIPNDITSSELNVFEKILLKYNKDTYLLASDKFKKMDQTEFIEMLEEVYNRTIVKQYINFAELTLTLINDLKYGINPKLAIDYYFIRIAEEK